MQDKKPRFAKRNEPLRVYVPPTPGEVDAWSMEKCEWELCLNSESYHFDGEKAQTEKHTDKGRGVSHALSCTPKHWGQYPPINKG